MIIEITINIKDDEPEVKETVKKTISTLNRLYNLFINSSSAKTNLPIGVIRRVNGYGARVSIYGKRKGLGGFNTPEEAAEAYRKAKREHCNTEIHKAYAQNEIPFDRYMDLLEKTKQQFGES